MGGSSHIGSRRWPLVGATIARGSILAVTIGLTALIGMPGCSSEPDPADVPLIPELEEAAAGNTKTGSGGAAADATGSSAITVVGVAFVDASVTAQGSLAKLPPGTEIHPVGSTITGTTGCPTTRTRQDGLAVVVIDYTGRPTSATLTVTQFPEIGSRFARAPYHFDLDQGRTIQMLGPSVNNGAYELALKYDFSRSEEKSLTVRFELARNCPRTG